MRGPSPTTVLDAADDPPASTTRTSLAAIVVGPGRRPAPATAQPRPSADPTHRRGGSVRRFLTYQVVPKAAFAALLVVVWNTLAARSTSRLMPDTGQIWHATWELFATGVVWGELSVTVQRVLVAFAASFVAAIVLGVAMGRSRWFHSFFEPAIVAGLTVPGLAWAFLSVIWFGVSWRTSLAAVMLSTVPLLTLNVIQGTRAVDPDLVAMARVFGFSRWTRLRYVYVGALLPSLLGGARLALSLGWKVVVLVEVFGLSSGVGYQMNSSFARYDVAGVFAWTLAFTAVMFIVEYGVLAVVERRVTRWRRVATP